MQKLFIYLPPSSLLWLRHLTFFLLPFWKQVVATPKKWVHLLSLLTLFIVQWTMLSEQVHAQSLQWSQYTNPTNSSVFTWAVEKVPNGPIYALSEVRPLSSTTPVVYSTSNSIAYGSVLRSTAFTMSVLTKYSADGSTIEWVRLLSTSSTGNLTALDLALSPSNEPVVILKATSAASELITSNAWQPNPPIFTGTGNSLLLAKFSASGALTYGTYIGPTGGARNLAGISPANTQSPQFLKIGADGTTYIAFSSGKSDDSQTGVIPTTAGAIMTANDPVRAGTSLISNEHLMIFKPDNTLAYSTYLPTSSSSLSGWDLEVAPNGDLYLGNSAQVTAQLLPAPTFQSFEPAGSILRFSNTGQLLGGTYIPNLTDGGWTSGSLAAISLRPNGNVVVATSLNSLIEFNSTLDAVLSHFRPFGNGFGVAPTDIGIDATGRVHYLSANSRPVITSGALQGTDATAGTNYAHYSIIDCNTNNIVYATNIGTGQPGRTIRLVDIEIEGNTAYISGPFTLTSQSFPVTPTAYNSTGTATVSGYDITASAFNSGGTGNESAIVAFNIPAFKANTNTLTTPAITTFCSGTGVLPINGTKAEYITPNVIGKTSANPAPTPTHYQWQVATSSTGPWVDISDSDIEDYKPEAPATPGQYFYRRLVRQTPFGKGFCVPVEDITQTSNVVSLTFSNNKSHTTNIPDGKYGICKGGAALALSYTLTPSSDGSFAPYNYKLTSTANLATTVFGQSGTVAAAPGSINLNVGVAGEYILQVTDSRGCVSFDTLKIENLTLDAGSATKFTCGETSVKIGPLSLPPTYINYPTNNFAWSPATGLDNPLSVSPTFTHGLAVGDSTMKYLTFNGCIVDSIKIVNRSITPLPTLPDLAVCQGDTLRLGTGGPGTAPILVAQSGVTYQWAPGLGLTSNNVANPLVTTIFAPQGVNEVTYTVLATAGNTGCAQTTTQKLTTYREPNQSFNLKQCMSNGCTPDSTLRYGVFGTDAEPGISYSWTATVVDDPANTGTTGLPTNAQALAFLSSSSASKVTLNSGTPGLGYASNYGYKIIYVRTSFNTANPTCMRTDTAELSYCCGSGPACLLALGNLPSISCGGPDNKIGPKNFSPGGLYYWSRLDGQPLNNELFDSGTNQPLSATGPHPFQVIANPSGTVPVDYRLTYIPNQIGADTCRVDIKVFPGAISKPNVTYPSPQSVCQGTPYTIQGPAQQPALTYLWSPISMLQSTADSSKALPTLKGLNSGSSLYVTVTDPTTGCATKDTVALVVTPVEVEAGIDASFCQSGATLDIGTLNAIQGYTYQWTASPSAGVTFGDATKPKTTVTLPTTTVGNKITLYLTATNGLTPANCVLKDSVIMTSAASPTVSIPTTMALCTTGGEVKIGPVSPSGSGTTYTWTGPGIVSGQGTNTITVNATGAYQVTVGQGACTATASRTIAAATNPTVNLTPAAACATDVTIGATTMTNAQRAGWLFSWDKYDALKGNANDLSTITVRPTATTTYTLTATHASGCTQTFPVVVPAAAYTATLPEILNFCEGQSAVLPLNDPSSVSGTVTWTATPTSALAYLSSSTAVDPTIDMSLAPAGAYTYTATVSYPTGCISTASVRVNIGKKIENIAGIDREICAGSCTNLGVLPISGVSYEWSATPTDPKFILTLVPRPLVCPTTSTTYKLKYTDAAGCQYTDDVFVKVNESPSLEVTNLKICQNTSGTATANLATAIVTNTGTTTSYWANATATIAAPNTINYGGTFYVKTESASGCFVIKPVIVTFNDLPTAKVTPAFDCATQKGSLQIATSTTGLRYDYTTGTTYTGSKTFANASILSSNTFINNLSALNTTDYTVRVFGADSVCYQDYMVKIVNNCPKGSIGDVIWKDINDNGLQDLPTEKGVAGVKVNLYAASGGTKTGSILQTKTTGTDGLYLFTGLLAGDYIVEIDKTSLKDTCAITTKQNTGSDDTKDSDFNPTSGLSQVITLNPVFNPTTAADILATNNLTVDAGLVKVCILPTRTVAATGPTCLVAGKIEITATNGDKYGVSKGATYTGPAYASATAVGTLPILIKGNISHAADSTWTIRVFNKDNTCLKDTTVTVKALVKDATVSVANGFPVCRQNGTAYTIKFTKSPAGAVVTAKNVATGATIPVTGDSVANIPLTVASVRLIVTNGVCKDSITVTAPTCDKPVGSIGDLIWKDTNDNGLQDLPTEKGVAGVKVNLYAASGGTKTGSILQTKTTGTDGLYLFTGLLAGDYIVEIDKTSLKDTCAITTKQNTGGDDTKDSDFNPTTGLSQVVTLNPVFNPTTAVEILATNNLTVDAGLVKVCIKPTLVVRATDPTCAVVGKIELTATNGDKYGVSKGATYTGPAYTSATTVGTLPILIKGNISHAADSTWTIRVFNKDNTCFKDTTVTVKALVKDATVSVANGFPVCRQNGTAYTIKFTKSPAGAVVTAKNVATGMAIPVTGDSVANVPLTVASVRLIVTSGVCKDSVEVNAPVCDKPVGSIGDLIWKDTNDNGLQDLPTEKGVAGIKVNLYAASSGTKTGSILQTKTTGIDGLYLFTGLLAGDYIVEIDKTSLKDTCAITTKQNTGGDDTKDSDFSPTTGLSQVITLNPVFNPTTPTEILATNNLTVDAALVVPCVKSKVILTGAPVCSADIQTYSITFSVTGKNGIIKVNRGTLTGANPYTVTGIPSGATIKITDSLSAVCKFDTLITGPNCNCNPPLPILIAGSVTACAGDTFPTLKATVVGLGTVEWFTQATGGTAVFTGLNYKPSGTVPTTGAVFYAQARSTDPTCPTAISTSRVMATINAQDCAKEVDLALKKSINTKIAQIGNELTYTLKVWNESNTNATGVEVVDSIATTVQFQTGSFVASRGSASINGNVIKWGIGNISANGDTVTLTYRVKATQEGVHFNTAEISKTNEKDKDSTPGNGKDSEDDIDHQCFTVPIKLCTGSKVEASVSTKYTNVQWFKDGGSVPVASGNVVLLSGVGIYTYTASNQTCPAGGCCPIIIENNTNCCPVEKCVPLTIKKIKK